MPSNQKQIIEQAKFAYSPLRKAFEKQRKTIEDQGEKQLKAIEYNKKQLDYKKELSNNGLLLSKERETFKIIYNKRLIIKYMNYLKQLIMVTLNSLLIVVV